jgi:hypothetical protein
MTRISPQLHIPAVARSIARIPSAEVEQALKGDYLMLFLILVLVLIFGLGGWLPMRKL